MYLNRLQLENETKPKVTIPSIPSSPSIPSTPTQVILPTRTNEGENEEENDDLPPLGGARAQSSLRCTRSVFSESSLGFSSSVLSSLESSGLSWLSPFFFSIGEDLDCGVVLDNGIPVFLVIAGQGLSPLYSEHP